LVIPFDWDYNEDGNLSVMAMRNRIKKLVDSKGISVYQFWQDTGISRNTAYALYNNPDQYPGRDVMDAICATYRVQPGDLLEWVGDQSVATTDTPQPEPEQKSRRGKPKSEPKSEPMQLQRGQVVKIPSGARAWVDRMLENGKVALTVEGLGEDVYPVHMLTVTDLVV
jgi:DNA-binding Xre family transcriptional regulator